MADPFRRGVLLLAENTDIGGISTYVGLLAEGFVARGIPVEVAAVWRKPADWLGARCHSLGVPFFVLAEQRSVARMPAAAHRLARRINERGYAIVHTQAHYSSLVGRAAYVLGGRRTRLVSTVHGITVDDRLGLRLFFWLDWHTYRWNHAVIANSEDTKRRLHRIGIRAAEIEVVLHGVVTRAEAAAIAGRPSPPLLDPARRPVIGFVGRLSWEKGSTTLVEAAHRLAGRGLDFELLIVGDGPEREMVEGLVRERGLAERTRLAGWQTELAPFYEQMDILAVPSVHESLGLVILEGMLHGRAVVATRVRGIPEIVQDGQTGRLVGPSDPDGLADALQACLTAPERTRQLARSGRDHVLRRHTIEGMIDQTLGVYRTALASWSAGSNPVRRDVPSRR